MGLWPFGKKNKKNAPEATEAKTPKNPSSEYTITDLQEGVNSKDSKETRKSAAEPAEEEPELAPAADNEPATETEVKTDTESAAEASTFAETPFKNEALTHSYTGPVTVEHDAVGGGTGPFDGDSVDIKDFDFSDFAEGILNLGSIQLPLPKGSQVQVEMGEQGPRMLHVVTEFGRITPVAFAAPNSGGMWEESSDEIIEGMQGEGMPASFEEGPWGREVVGRGENGIIRIVGVEGPRWLYRVTLAAPHGKEDQLAELAHEIIARSFIYRGTSPVLAGNSLPVELPAQLAAQLQQAMAQQQQQNQGQTPNTN